MKDHHSSQYSPNKSIEPANLIVNRDQLKTITDAMGEGLLLIDHHGTFAFMNPAAEKLLGWTFEEVKGKHVHETIHFMKEDGSPFPVKECGMYTNAFDKKREWRDTDVLIKKDGTFLPIEYTATPILVDDSTYHVVIVFRDITEQKKEQEKILHQAMYDDLTGLPNRFYFKRALIEKIGEAKDSEQLLGILMLDIDRFKYINDSLGHDIGDSLLKKVGQKINKIATQIGAITARMGGDEFLILTPPLTHIKDIYSLGDKLLKAFCAPINVNGIEFFITPSIGISIFPEHGEDDVTLIKKADVAMYKAKKQRNQYKIYDPVMNHKAKEQLQLDFDLRQAFLQGDLELHYQPQIDINTHECVGVEALLRWHHPKKGWISPGTFLPLAEETGLIIQIDSWVLHQAAQQLKNWLDQGIDLQRMSINISNKMFHSGLLVNTVKKILKETQLDPSMIELELTENITMYEDTTSRIMQDLKNTGVQISIDDFGTGYSSLGSLKTLPFDRLKIDRSFIQGILPHSKEYAIVTSIVTMARTMGIGVMAEGVESLHELKLLKSLKCHEAQGFYFSKPLPVQDIESYFDHLKTKFVMAKN